jgi:glutamate--cysteine ligase
MVEPPYTAYSYVQEAPFTAVINAFAQDAVDRAEPLTVAAAYAQCRDVALAESVIGAIGLEIESHLVDLDHVSDPVPWRRVEAIAAAVGEVAPGTAVTVEPGGQIELSGPPEAGVAPAVARLRYQGTGARLVLADRRLGLAYAGADPARPSRRVNPRPRYRAMEQHFAAIGRAGAGQVMMNSTAALQVNLQAGPPGEWPARVARAYRLGPTLVAIAASSPWLHGRDTGWKSVRQRAWSRLDPRTCGPVPGCAPRPGRAESLDPASAWARFAMRAPVMFVRGGDDVLPVGRPVPFEQWASGAVNLVNRSPTVADLDTHLSTLFPPVRLRGYLEVRYLDMSAPRWWPAIAAVTATLMDDAVAADLATEATEPATQLWTEAARDGLANATLATCARRCMAIAADRVPTELRPAVADLADLVESGRCPGDLLAERVGEIGPLAALGEMAHA